MEVVNAPDQEFKDSPYYVREKIELGILGEDHGGFWLKAFIMFILTVYVYGAMSLKYVSGAESLIEAFSFILHEDSCYLYRFSAF